MDNELSLTFMELQKSQAISELHKCNELTEKYGLSLSEKQIESLVTARFNALIDTGRIEFAEGILPKLIYAFCDSPYISQDNFEETITELQDSFYYFKGESMELFSDDELIEYMKIVFDGRAQGSLEYLSGTSLEELCRYAREGFDPFNRNSLGDLF